MKINLTDLSLVHKSDRVAFEDSVSNLAVRLIHRHRTSSTDRDLLRKDNRFKNNRLRFIDFFVKTSSFELVNVRLRETGIHPVSRRSGGGNDGVVQFILDNKFILEYRGAGRR